MPRVLVVDDVQANLDLMVSLLRILGNQPVTATSGQEAVELAKVQSFDVVLLDIQMPGMDGFETARALRAIPSLEAVPFVAVTALAMPGDRERILDAGFSGYISKPIDAQRLPGQLASFLPPREDA